MRWGRIAGALVFALAAAYAVAIWDDRGSTALGEKLSDYAGAWDGYSEGYVFEFASDSDRLRLSIDPAGNGTLQVGVGTATIPAIDPAVPPFGPWSVSRYDLARLTGGFRYPLHELRVEDRRLRFVVDSTDLFRDWCRAKTPKFHPEEGGYSCGFTGFYTTLGDDTCTVIDPEQADAMVPVDCGLGMLCSPGPSHCECDATSCDAHAWPDDLIRIELALTGEGDEMAGVMLTSMVSEPPRVDLRFSRRD